MISLARKRPRMLAFLGISVYGFAGFTVGDVHSLRLVTPPPESCPVSSAPASGGGHTPLTVLQGNTWMLPVRPLLFPFAFATDREPRLERLIEVVRACKPEVVVLQEVFERSMVRLVGRSLPGYSVFTSGESDFFGTVNASGLVTLTRLPAGEVQFRPFAPLPDGAKTIEKMARKGVLAVDLGIEGEEVTILNTHLYAWDGPEEEAITDGQLEEVLDYVDALEASGRRVLVVGDFNIRRAELARRLEEGWTMSQHGPTYVPDSNPYTVQGANNTPLKRAERRNHRGARTIDFLLASPSAPVGMTSRVLAEPLVSDHQILYHTVSIRSPAASTEVRPADRSRDGTERGD